MNSKFMLTLFLCFIPVIPLFATNKTSSTSFRHRCWSGIKTVVGVTVGVTAGAMLGAGVTCDVQEEGRQWPLIKAGCSFGSLAVLGMYGISRWKMGPLFEAQAELQKAKSEVFLINQRQGRSESIGGQELERLCNQTTKEEAKVRQVTKSISSVWRKAYPLLSPVAKGVGGGLFAGLAISQPNQFRVSRS